MTGYRVWSRRLVVTTPCCVFGVFICLLHLVNCVFLVRYFFRLCGIACLVIVCWFFFVFAVCVIRFGSPYGALWCLLLEDYFDVVNRCVCLVCLIVTFLWVFLFRA